MILGPIVDSAAVILGGVGGAFFAKRIPERLRTALPMTFGLASMGLGIEFIFQVKQIPAMVLAIILGSLIGELVYLEKGITAVGNGARTLIERLIPHHESHTALSSEDFSKQFVAILILFSASGTGIFGALTNGMTGDPTILLAKSILDLFTAAIFATALGYTVALIFIPQFAIQMGLALCAVFLLPLTTPVMMADFSACGGLIMLATGFRICGIKTFPIANFLPALVLVMPISYLWTTYAPG
ncbi:DUF554 domain-containing protein [Sphingomonas sp. 10B4]|uniref:DUF554 domain-containing protein n=1 Tax=Sphingomonas sp. 10B4 TaxID=3048575 RepID=UPI002AB362F9|nr:DUF554 domain-containing protein [Sphingomonas sp. 10B4]MDY7526199.1 DUF554 domain-containing protein [Sphingomonas sp. 10B4]MEB0283835.1 DUF554 domain-containing protein [Sphingomonas sp. 10B4]